MQRDQNHRDEAPIKVVIAFNIAEHLLEKIRRTETATEIVAVGEPSRLSPEQLRVAEIVLCWDYRPEHLLSSPNLRWIHKMSTGVDRMLYPELLQSNVILTNSSGAHAIPIAEHVIGVMLAFVKDLPLAFRKQQKHAWIKEHTRELYGRTAGIIGLGKVGDEVAKRAKAMSMNVLAVRRRDIGSDLVDEILPVERLHELLGRSDFVVMTLPLTAATRNYLKATDFAAMRPDAYFINIARGQVVDEPALIDALHKRHIAGAALDVAAVEPLPPENPLWDMENVIITPHTSGHSEHVHSRAVDLFCSNLGRFRRGEPLVNVVDKVAGY